MSKKFLYSPGLPGYGTKGTDGSTGLQGLALYFSSYDGLTESISIKQKIVNNQILFPGSETLPEYPDRKYVTGDLFVDKNGRIFKIDLLASDRYVNTSQVLNTSGFFEQGPNTVNTPVYARYSNYFDNPKFLIDIVYSSSALTSYANNPSRVDGSIYGVGAIDFGQIKFVNNQISGHHPYTVFVNSPNILEPEKAFAIVKEDGSNTWHIGNKDGGGKQRDIDLKLDFKEVYVDSSLHVENLFVSNFNLTSGNLSIPGNLYVAGDGSINSLYVGSDVSIGGDLYVDGSVYFENPAEFDGDIILNEGRIIFNDSTDSDGQIFSRDTSVFKPRNLKFTAGSAIGIDGSNGGSVILTAGQGSPDDSSISGSGGYLSIKGGDGGQGIFPGRGGDVSISGGNAKIDLDSSISYLNYPINAGNLYLSGGKGWSSEFIDADYVAGKGGDILLLAGLGGDSSSGGGSGGKGGHIYIKAGDQGDGAFSIDEPGSIYINPGNSPGGYGNIFLNKASGVYICTSTGFDSDGNIYLGKTIYLGGTDTSVGFRLSRSTARSLSFYVNSSLTSSSSQEMFRFDVSTFYARGNVIAYSSMPSDIRLKTNIQPLEDSLDKVLLLNGISYDSKEGSHHLGFIAQDIEPIMPEVILETPILGEPDDVLYKTIKYTEIIPHLVESIKTQQKMIEQQRNDINRLIWEIEQLKKIN